MCSGQQKDVESKDGEPIEVDDTVYTEIRGGKRGEVSCLPVQSSVPAYSSRIRLEMLLMGSSRRSNLSRKPPRRVNRSPRNPG